MSRVWLVQLAAVALVLIDVAVRAWRIRLLLPAGQRPPLWRAAVVNAYGDAASSVTPARLGGDPARFVGFRRSGVDAPGTVVALGAELAIDWILLAVATAALVAGFGDRVVHGGATVLRGLTSRSVLPWLLLVVLLVAASALAARWYRGRHPEALAQSLGKVWRSARSMSVSALLASGLLTATSMAVRVAILPLLLVGMRTGVELGSAVVGSFALLYGQLVLPSPSGVGGVELGFVVGLAPALSTAEIAGLLVLWRVYTTGIPSLLGAGAFLLRALGRRRRTGAAFPSDLA